jgi:hypothetical protein
MNKLNPNHYKIIIRDISEGSGEAFEAYIPAFDAHNFGDTIDAAIKSYFVYFKSEEKRRKKLGIDMPKPDVMREKVKQVPLRLPENIYEKIMSKAKEKGMSFNGFVSVMLDGV